MSQTASARLSSVARKLIMGVTGLALIGFVVTHLAGNLNFFAGKEAFNKYADALHSIPGFPLIELSLAAIFVVHIVTALSLIRDNAKARPQDYAVQKHQTTLSARLMPVSGIMVLVFLFVHMATIRARRGAEHMDGPFGIVGDALTHPVWAPIYVVGSLMLIPHLRHGIHSSLRSLGMTQKDTLAKIEKLSLVIAVVVCGGFASLPLFALMNR
ncbi:MAG: succinate dehydrogenase cytochrome b subunit [Myxococcota bacterium]